MNKPAILMAAELGIDIIDHCDEMDAECYDKILAADTTVVPSVFFPKVFMETIGAGLGFSDAMRSSVESAARGFSRRTAGAGPAEFAG